MTASAHQTRGATIANATHHPYRTLAHRTNDWVEVVLFWHETEDETGDELTVTVSDERAGVYFELPAAPDQALDVFNHPYAYAAFRGLPFDEASPRYDEASPRYDEASPPAWPTTSS